MKKLLIPCLAAALAAAVSQAAPADDLRAAAKKLNDAPNYTWTATTENAGGGGFGAGTATGQTEKGGFTVVTREFNGNTFQSVRHGEQVVLQNMQGEWMTRDEMMQQFGGGQGGAARGGRGGMFAVATPADDLLLLAAQSADLKAADGVISGDLTPAALAERLTFGRGGPNPPRNASGSVKVWLKDGALAKLQVHVKGTVTGRNGEDREIDRTTTTEIKEVGSTKVQVPDTAKKKLGT